MFGDKKGRGGKNRRNFLGLGFEFNSQSAKVTATTVVNNSVMGAGNRVEINIVNHNNAWVGDEAGEVEEG